MTMCVSTDLEAWYDKNQFPHLFCLCCSIYSSFYLLSLILSSNLPCFQNARTSTFSRDNWRFPDATLCMFVCPCTVTVNSTIRSSQTILSNTFSAFHLFPFSRYYQMRSVVMFSMIIVTKTRYLFSTNLYQF